MTTTKNEKMMTQLTMVIGLETAKSRKPAETKEYKPGDKVTYADAVQHMVYAGEGSERGYVSRRIETSEIEGSYCRYGRRAGCWKFQMPRWDTSQYTNNVYFRSR